MRPKTAIFVTAVAVGVAAYVAVATRWQVLVNHTESLPQVLFVIDKWATPRVGDYVAFRHQAPFLPEVCGPSHLVDAWAHLQAAPTECPALLVKQLAAASGDRIDVRNGAVLINDSPVAIAKPTALTGMPLAPVDPQTLAEGELFMLGHHKDSYDSRYALFGPVRTGDLVGVARPLF
jgi:conjugal transfer pilin signal peptidase TrbI